MTIWRREHGRGDASPHTLSILADIETEFRRFAEPRPQVASIRIGAGMRDHHDFEVEVELVPGTVLAVRYQSVDEEGRDPDDLENESGAVGALVVHRTGEYLELGTGLVADTLHDLRVRTRKGLAEWSTGAGVQLFDVRLMATEYLWPEENALNLEVRLIRPDARLRPTVGSFELRHPDGLDALLAGWRPHLEKQVATLAALSRQGADGTIDELALNAIRLHGDVGHALREIGSGRPALLSEALTLYVSDHAHVRCHGWDPRNSNFRWNRNSIRIEGATIPEILGTSLVGRTMTDLVEHRVLTTDMIITSAYTKAEHGICCVHAEFEQPRWLFCGASGRIWLPDRELEFEEDGDG